MKALLCAALLIVGTSLAKADTIETITFNLGDLHPGSTLSATFDVPTVLPGPGLTENVIYSFSDPLDYAEGSLNGPTGGTLAGTVSIEGNAPISNYIVSFAVPTFYNPSGDMFDQENNLSPRGFAECDSFPCTATGGFSDSMAFNSDYTIAPAAMTPEPASFVLLFTGLAGAGLLYEGRKHFI